MAKLDPEFKHLIYLATITNLTNDERARLLVLADEHCESRYRKVLDALAKL